MRKLATVTAAAALVAAMIMLPAASAIAEDQGGVQILKCAQSIGIDFGGDDPFEVIESAGFGPTVVMIEGDFDEPETCKPDGFCTQCLNDLITDSGCSATDFPGSPLIVHSSTQQIGDDDDDDPNEIFIFSITEYVFLCSGGAAETE